MIDRQPYKLLSLRPLALLCLTAGLLIAGRSPLRAADTENILSLRVEPAYASPNDDGLQDQLFFYPVRRSKREVARWRLDIENAKHKLVQRLTGAGFPALIKWDAFDRKGEVAPDGHYTARFEVWGKHLNRTAEQSFDIDTKAPQVFLALSTNVVDSSVFGGGAVQFTPQVDDASPIDRWQLQILNETGRTVQVIWSTGPVRPMTWDGTDRATNFVAPQGRYRAVYQVWDKAGNGSEPFMTDLTVSVTAREMLEHALQHIEVIQTPMGLLVQLKSDQLFNFKKGRPVFKPTAKDYLREVSILVNAYPDVPVKLDGYSKSAKKAERDREMASLYAWRVYSYLNKYGNVKASRVTVRGRGRSPMFDRRSISVPVIRNGVEVLLASDRKDW